MQILFEDNHLLVVVKPAGIATMGEAEDEPSLWRQACDDIGRRYQKPGRVYLGVVSRLDKPVSGVVVFARTSKAAARLNVQFRERTVDKTYWAIVAGLTPPAGTWEDWLAPLPNTHRTQVVKPGAAGGQLARMHFQRKAQLGTLSWLEIKLETGRKHQIRVQAAHHGHSVVGDGVYGSQVSFSDGIALHAQQLELEHPVSHTRLTFSAPPPHTWNRWQLDRK